MFVSIISFHLFALQSNGFRFTFHCPNESFYNRNLMACEQNATQLYQCKMRSLGSIQSTMATVTTINVPDNLIPPEAEPLTLSGVTAAGLEDIGHYTATTPVSDHHHGSDHGNDDRLSTNSSSPTDDWPQWASVSTEPEPSQQLQQHQHERPPRVSTTAKMIFGAGGNNLSTTTLIPPSLFMEPTLSNIVVEENPPNLNHIFAVAYNNNNNNNGRNTMVTPNIEQSTATIDTTTIGNAKLAILQIPRNQIFKESKSNGKTTTTTTTSTPTTSTTTTTTTTTISTINKQSSMKGNLSRQMEQLSPKTVRWEPMRVNTQKANNVDHLLKDLDMSNFELKGIQSYSNIMNQVSKQTPKKSKHQISKSNDLTPNNGKLSLSIHKFFKEGLSGQHLKNMPKLIRGLNSNRDLDTRSSSLSSSSSSLPHKNDMSIDIPPPPPPPPLPPPSSPSSEPELSMYSIPVLVPLNLSRDDYRRRMSSSILKPIIIPLKEKGKLIPAYVLQFPSKWNKSRRKRSALNGKRLLSLSIKPNLLYHVIPSLLKSVYIKPVYGKSKIAMARPKIPKHLGLLMASQNVLPMYLPNPNHPLPLVPGQPNQMPGQKGNPQFGNMYADLADFAPFIPPYYFVDQGKPANVQHRPQSALKKFFKRPPLRSKIPNGSNTANGTNTSNTNKSLSSSSSSGLMAVGSSPNVAKIPTIASPYMFGNLGPTQLPQLMGAAYSPSTFGHAYYSPLLFLDNTFVGADASRFKPLIKKMKQKQKAKQNAFNVKAEAASTPNITMPANIYVPDDILEDYSQNDQQLTSNQTDNKNENSMMNEKVTNDLDESLHSEESNPMESLFGRQEPDSNNRKQLIKDRIDEEENRSGLSPQAQINANFFNGTAPRSTKPKTKLKPNSNRVKDILRTRSKVTKSISSEQFKANSNNPFNSESNRSNNTNAYQNNDDIDYVDEMEPASSSSSSISLDTFLRHLRANPDGDHSQ